MPTKSAILQPIIYDMMLLAQALIDLEAHVDAKRGDPLYPRRENALGSALIRLRSLAEFWGGRRPKEGGKKKGNDIITVEDPSLQWEPDRSFYEKCWQPVSEYVGHPIDKRYKKTTKRPTVRLAQRLGKRILKKTSDEIDRRTRNGELTLVGDAERWYGRFKELYIR